MYDIYFCNLLFVQLKHVRMVNTAVHVASSVLLTVRLPGVIKMMVTVNVKMDIMERAVNGAVPETVIFLVIKPQGHVQMVAKTVFMVLTVVELVLNIVNMLNVNREMIFAHVTMVIMD